MSGVGKTTGSSCAAATSAALSATSVPPMTWPRPFRPCSPCGVGHVPLQVQEAVVGRVQDAQAVRLRLQRHRRVGRAVHDRRVVELLHPGRDVRRARDQLRLAERIGLVLPGGRVVQVAGHCQGCSRLVPDAIRPLGIHVVVRVGDRAVLGVAAGGQNHGPYIQRPNALMPLGSPGFCAGM